MDERMIPVIIVAVIVAIGVGFVLLGWRNRRRRQSALDVVAVPPAEIGAELGRERVLYVATTLADEPLERVVVGGLGFRAKGEIVMARGGIVLELAGNHPAFIPVGDIQGVGLASWTIDKGVGEAGLVLVRWQLGDTTVDSYLRADDPQRLLDQLTELSPTAAEAARREAASAETTPQTSDGEASA